MTVEGEKRHYTTIKSVTRLLKSLNATHKDAYHFYMNCLNGFRTESARDKHYEQWSRQGQDVHWKRKMVKISRSRVSV